MPRRRPIALLDELDRLRADYGPESARNKLDLIRTLEARTLPDADALRSLHDQLCFLRAYPDNAEVLAAAERVLKKFESRSDFQRFRPLLADTGIVGTELFFRFYWLTAVWVQRNWPGRLRIDWEEFERSDRLDEILHLLVPYTESPALDSFAFPVREWIDRLKGPHETDADFVIQRFARLRVGSMLREQMYDDLDIPMILEPGPTTPARSRERWGPSPVVFRSRSLDSARPDLRRAIDQVTMRVSEVPRREARGLIHLANSCMVPRHRDLLAFLNADERDVRMIDFGDGLRFVCMGTVPERRLMLESVYAILIISNGVPIGYVLFSAFFSSAEVAYNVFETFRGGEAARNYARLLAVIHRLFGAESFAVDPYQLGHDNAEGQQSGAWWFYYKLGFRPRSAGVKRLVREELARMRKHPGHRTSPARLNDLSAEYMYLQLGPPRRDVLGEISLGNIGLHASRLLAQRGGSDREGALDACADQAAALLGLRSVRALSPGEREAWRRWSPLALALPGVKRWSAGNRHALRDIIKAKGGRREADYVRLFDRHALLRRAMLKLAEHEP